jgi:vacuolar protein sorting-associated protein 13D
LQGSKVSFSTFELKTSSVSICIIDDCKDADVPLLDLTVNHLHLAHKVAGTGRATASLSGKYKNRRLYFES